MKKEYLCDLCDFKTNRKDNYNNHILTSKHKNNVFNSNEYKCEKCNYSTSSQQNFQKHLESNKHKKIQIQHENETFDINLFTKIDHELKETKNELKETIQKMDNIENNIVNHIVSLKEIINSNQPTTTINSHNTNSLNTFNLQFFLNETCKDAMNITEFVESIEVGIKELKFLGKKGYVEAISSLIINNLNKLDITKRPMHCSDVKRENIYIRTKNAWEKENKENKVTNNLIVDVQRANTIAVQGKYQEEFPQCMTDYNSKEHKEYGEIVYQAFGGKGDIDDLNKKIIRRIVKEIQIDKNM
mgnify:CR=1 FL=1|jgi:hypothetical protein